MALNDYATQLAALKKSYAAASAAAQGDISKQGNQLRQQASGAGVDLNALEDAANGLIGQKVDVNSADEQTFRNTNFKAATSAPVFNPTAGTNGSSGVPAATSTQYRNEDIAKAHQYMTQLDQLINNKFTYNPDSDPLVAAAKANQAKRSAASIQDMQLDLNARGILDSTVTGDRAAEIYKAGDDAVTAQIPQYAQLAYGQNQNQISNLASLMSTQLNAGIDQEKFDAQLPMQEAALTGHYLSGDAKGLINQVLALKTNAENPLATSAQVQQFASQANALRQQLTGMGIDADALFGSQLDAKDAAANSGKAGALTVDAQKALASTLLGLGDTYGSIPTGTGAKLGALPLFQGLGDTVTNLEGKPNMAQKQLDLTAEKFAFDKTSTGNSQAVAWANLELNKLKNKQDQDEISKDENSKKATVGYLTEILSMKSREEAMSYIVQHAPDLVKDNANVQNILDNIDAKFPKPTSASNPAAAKPIDMIQVNKDAQDAAMKDIVSWNAAKGDKAKEDALIEKAKQRILKGIQ